VIDRELRHFGVARLPSRTTLLALSGGRVVVVSPPAGADAALRSAIGAIGTVTDVVVPNSFHHLFAGAFHALHPAARLWVPPGLKDRLPGFDPAVELDERVPDPWAGELEVVVLGPVRGVSELLLFHGASGSLLLTDLAFHMRRYPRAFDRWLWRASGIPAGFGPGRTTRALLLRDRDAAARALHRALEWPIRRIVVAHGDAIEHDARRRLHEAFAGWLR